MTTFNEMLDIDALLAVCRIARRLETSPAFPMPALVSLYEKGVTLHDVLQAVKLELSSARDIDHGDDGLGFIARRLSGQCAEEAESGRVGRPLLEDFANAISGRATMPDVLSAMRRSATSD
jgi:hypothetical protein